MSDKGKNSGFNHLLPCLCHEIGCCMGPRGQKEPHALTYSSFEYGVEDEVEAYMGLRYICLNTFNGADKSAPLSLSNPYQYESGSFLKMWDNRKDPLNVVNLFFFYVEQHLKPAMEFYKLEDAPFWNRRAPAKELKVCFRHHIHCFCIALVSSNSVFLSHIETPQGRHHFRGRSAPQQQVWRRPFQ